MKNNTTLVFPVAGLGTRFLPITKAIPKEMLPVGNKPLIQYAYEEGKKVGIKRFIFIFGKNKNTLINYFDPNFEIYNNVDEEKQKEIKKQASSWLDKDDEIIFIRQNQPLGLGHAILCAKNLISKDSSFSVILPDELFLGKTLPLENIFKDSSSDNVIGFDNVEKDLVMNYGVLKLNQNNDILDVVEKPLPKDAPSNKIIVGRYVLSYEIFNYLENQKPGKNNEIQLTDAIKRMIQDGVKFKGVDLSKVGKRFDCGSIKGFIEANNYFLQEVESFSRKN